MPASSHLYILKDGEVIQVDSPLEWAEWFESADRIVSRSEVGDVLVSTVFLGLDHNFTGKGGPVLFETMVFGGTLDGSQERYSDMEDAMAGHDRWVFRAQGIIKRSLLNGG